MNKTFTAKLWPLSDDFCRESDTAFSSDNRHCYPVDSSPKYAQLWTTFTDELRAILPEHLTPFNCALHGHMNGSPRGKYLSMWWDLQTVRFISEAKPQASAMEIRLEVSHIGLDLAQYLARATGASEHDIARKDGDSTKLSRRQLQIDPASPSAGRDLAVAMATLIAELVPMLQTALVAWEGMPRNMFCTFHGLD